jgi:hypothetical protein
LIFEDVVEVDLLIYLRDVRVGFGTEPWVVFTTGSEVRRSIFDD